MAWVIRHDFNTIILCYLKRCDLTLTLFQAGLTIWYLFGIDWDSNVEIIKRRPLRFCSLSRFRFENDLVWAIFAHCLTCVWQNTLKTSLNLKTKLNKISRGYSGNPIKPRKNLLIDKRFYFRPPAEYILYYFLVFACLEWIETFCCGVGISKKFHGPTIPKSISK